MELTADEIELIQKRRDKEAARQAAHVFQRKAISTANDFAKWSDEKNQGLAYSTFINDFFYQESDGKQMYAAVERILDAARPQ
ncbi:hypothetical protein HA050_11785 [Iodobacter sp. HSC-16F04]|uniref:Uncharacterized protein n=1 Tax=Iodobacter violaceini TaxID=3044271 RepID=A0ABX0KSU6_9NEIS|nr:hypothetical protein [Iodobacter violacea]NHQ86799.1 hypothetical protein [Iodobacter violacea]